MHTRYLPQNRHAHTTAAFMLALLGALSAPVLAQESTPNSEAAPAQEAPAQDSSAGGIAKTDDSDVLKMDSVSVTASAPARPDTSKFKSSISISTLDIEKLQISVPRNTAEIFRSIPAIRSEATAGDGNTNIAVRGMPISAGGSRYLQLHEDGVPVLEFGDIAFATADQFLRADYSVSQIDSVRGGMASTMSSNSPGGIINFLSKSGEIAGGSLGVTRGLDFDTSRVDLSYGSPLGNGMRFHVGGFYRTGEGARRSGYNGNNGGQVKFNLTKEFEHGYVKLFFKQLSDSTITYMPMPNRISGSANNPTIGSLPGFDVQRDTPHSQYFTTKLGLDGNGNRETVDITDGLKVNTTSIGAELSFRLPGGWELMDRINYAANSGRFTAPFPADILDAGSMATLIGGTGSTLSYATGPNAGKAITSPSTLNGNGLLMRTTLFDTKLNDFGMSMNNLRLTKSLTLPDESKLMFTLGDYLSRQKLNMDWVWNAYLLEVQGRNAALVDVTAANGTKITDKGLVSYGVPFWGNPTRNYDVSYDIHAPSASVSWVKGKINFDASVRFDSGKARGTTAGDRQVANFDMNQDGVISTPEKSVSVIDSANAAPVNYNWDYTSYSAGLNYAFTRKVAAFVRYSEGGRAGADRILFGSTVLADGTLRSKGASVDKTKQTEVGLKYRTKDLLPGSLGLFATAFSAETAEKNYEATTQHFTDRVYKAKGIELESAYHYQGFDLRFSATLTDAEISKDLITPAMVGHTPRRQSKFIYQVTPSYTFKKLSVGMSAIGTSRFYLQDNNDLVQPGYTYLNGFASYELTRGLVLSLNVNNLTNVYGLSEAEEGSMPSNGVLRGRGITGRTTSVTLRYSF